MANPDSMPSCRGRLAVAQVCTMVGLVLFVTWGLRSGRGDESAPALPKDGAWAQYQYEWRRVDNQQKSAGTATLSFVGRVLEKDDWCRWVELKFVITEGGEKGTTIYKLLIREKDLRESEHPLQHAVRAWYRSDDEPPRPIDAKRQDFDFTLGAIFLWTPGMQKNATAGDKSKDIEYQSGRLKGAQAQSGRVPLDLRNINGTVVRHLSRNFAVWRHADLPIGFAEAEIIDDISDPASKKIVNQQLTAYRLQNAGIDAKSALPENN